MAPASLAETVRKLVKPYRVTDGDGFRLADVDPDDTGGLGDADKPRAMEQLAQGLEALQDLQDKLYAQDRWAVLLIFQAMDAAGKDSIIKHVMSGVNPQGCQVYSFKAPTAEELDHDFLWRCACRLPERGRIGIFNRSYYEETLVVRVHQDFLTRQRLPDQLVTKQIWQERFEDIRGFERYLGRNGVLVRKFFLHVSRKEQKKRFLKRIDQPDKNWKFSLADVEERDHFAEYMTAYEDAIRHTASEEAPWFVVPADHKWFTRIVVGAAVVDALASLDLQYPTLDKSRLDELRVARERLTGEGHEA